MRTFDAGAYPVVPVGRLAAYISKTLTDDPKLRRIGVRGEITGISPQPNGNVYFDLKDRDALIKCIVWSEAAVQLPPLANGQAIVAVGSIGTYAKRSNYQLIVVHVEMDGVGKLHAIYEELKRRLEAEGLFAQARKRPLPRFPFRVGLISSRTANGAGDFLSQAASLAPHVTIQLFETPVQGEAAVPEIVRAIERASRADLDMIVLARGGGSYEDLFVFNNERVVRALAAARHPTVSAVGHEADAPLTDFVADHRAPTPSTAAQTVLPRRAELLRTIANAASVLERDLGRMLARLRRDLERIEIRSPLADTARLLAPRRQAIDTARMDVRLRMDARMRGAGARLATLARRLEARNPSVQLAERGKRLALAIDGLRRAAPACERRERVRVERLRERLNGRMRVKLTAGRARLDLHQARLNGVDPKKILERGYAIVRVNGATVRDAAGVQPGTPITAQVARGTLRARVESSEINGGE